MKYLATLIICLTSFSSSSYANWHYDETSRSIYSVYETKDKIYGDVYVIARIVGNEVSFTATVPFSTYRKTFTLTPPIILNYKNKKLVRHDSFFWGGKSDKESIKVDSVVFNSFHKSSDNAYQILSNKETYFKLIESFKNGDKVTLSKHYWDQNNKKSYPSFSLIGFTKLYNKHIQNDKNSIATINEFVPKNVFCEINGKRRAVWINTSHGTYALNGTAIDWFHKTKSTGSPLIGSDGNEWKIGKDYIDTFILSELIQVGLKKCQGL